MQLQPSGAVAHVQERRLAEHALRSDAPGDGCPQLLGRGGLGLAALALPALLGVARCLGRLEGGDCLGACVRAPRARGIGAPEREQSLPLCLALGDELALCGHAALPS